MCFLLRIHIFTMNLLNFDLRLSFSLNLTTSYFFLFSHHHHSSILFLLIFWPRYLFLLMCEIQLAVREMMWAKCLKTSNRPHFLSGVFFEPIIVPLNFIQLLETDSNIFLLFQFRSSSRVLANTNKLVLNLCHKIKYMYFPSK